MRAKIRSVFAAAAAVAVTAPAARAEYYETYATWQATVDGSWEVMDLSGPPFNVPAGAVVEIAVRNAGANWQRLAGVRAAGSALDRRFTLHEAEAGGRDLVVMHVQTDDQSRIEHYSEVAAEADFALLGYWTCATYVEAFQSFKAGAALSWQDHDLAAYGVPADHVAEIVMVNGTTNAERVAGVRADGSAINRLLNLHEAEAGGLDAATLFVQGGNGGSIIEVYAEDNAYVNFYLVGYWSLPPGTFAEAYDGLGSPTASATWEALDLGVHGVPAGAVAEIQLVNMATADEDQMGVRATGSGLGRVLDLHEAESGGWDFARMHVAADGASEVEFYHEDVTDAHEFRLSGYWTLVSQLGLSDHPAAQETDAFTNVGSETNAELLAFNLEACGGVVDVSDVTFSITEIAGLTNLDWAQVEIVEDTNGDGDIGAGETTTVGGAGTVDQAAGTITFTGNFAVANSMDYVLRADFAALSDGDTVTLSLSGSNVTAASTVVGATSTVLHYEGCGYFQRDCAWNATTAGAWETADLSVPPYAVPPDAVVEVAIRNNDDGNEWWGGVRAVGSTVDRRLQLHEGEDQPPWEARGDDFVVMHVQADAGGRIEHYAQDVSQVDFVLLGYWDCGEYREAYQQFQAAASSTWSDQDLGPYGVGAGNVAEIVLVNRNANAERRMGARADGSALDRAVDLHEAESGGWDTATLHVQASAQPEARIEVYSDDAADADFYLAGWWSVPPGTYSEAFAVITGPTADAAWQDSDLSSLGVPGGSVAEVVISSEWPDGPLEVGARRNGSTASRWLDLHEAESGGRDHARMHVSADGMGVIELYQEDVSRTCTCALVGSWQIGSLLALADHDAGPETDAFSESGAETDAELLAFSLTANIGSYPVTELVFDLTGISGLVDLDWSGVEIVVDDDGNGDIDAGETTTVGGAPIVSMAAGTITFPDSFIVSYGTNYILRADFASLEDADAVTVSLSPAGVAAVGTILGGTTATMHHEGCFYFERSLEWQALTGAAWEVKDLSPPPFRVPPDAVVEIAVSNRLIDTERWGGVRAVGSALDRRFQLHQAGGDGWDIAVMHVQADAGGRIEHYAETVGDVSFTLLGYWDCGTYVEDFNRFNAGAPAAWEQRDLGFYGVGSGQVAEIALVNTDGVAEHEAGVRSVGLGHERRINLHEAEAGGVDAATMLVKANSTADATIQIYAGDEFLVDFYLLGHWSSPPSPYRELFTDIGSPLVSGVWDTVDLSSLFAPENSVASILLRNADPGNERMMGARATGSSLDRVLDVHEAKDGGSDAARLLVAVGPTGVIEIYHEDVSSPHAFVLTGAWGNVRTPRLLRWAEVEP